jgi:hypothetical protein
MPALLVKIIGVFFYGYWIVLHKLDINSETYPLVRVKYIYLLLILPLLITDITLQTLYIANLSPDIITSCCAVVFGTSEEQNTNLLQSFSQNIMLYLFYGTTVCLIIIGTLLVRRWFVPLACIFSAGWFWFFGLALVTIITVFSSYIYAMPYHNCPFCVMKPEYHYIGFLIYGTLIPASFFGMTTVLVEPFKNRHNLTIPVTRYQQYAIKLSLLLLIILTGVTSYHFLLYRFMGGEF